MKTALISASFLLLLLSCRSGQVASSKVPSVVVNTVKTQYPVAGEIEWKKSGAAYEAELSLNDSTDVTLMIGAEGRLLMQKHDVATGALPPAVLAAVQSQYAAYTIDDAERIENDGAVHYQLELEGRGKKDVELVVTADGKTGTLSYWD